ncbi:hypothetical protein Mp_6g16520 [Marchantia polymorpha subsp. ruderalis]|uniref:Uncharacterized protein n=2 Tax=Marchantia polymorpha TaxID=3197 RepID=A0AAF6BSR2_MARPO|nr:hypothetical protein MARPO_0170s0025 [Marchantia polymorpha]BBN15046.1 hypothetical protein Mp_6g16520 [Marchantia polymorpha subsp. ruderalis]|eukprot:PTQ28221.1 hypothetical protein MARPO_0170s0025 [Marchantia polymorpha]
MHGSLCMPTRSITGTFYIHTRKSDHHVIEARKEGGGGREEGEDEEKRKRMERKRKKMDQIVDRTISSQKSKIEKLSLEEREREREKAHRSHILFPRVERSGQDDQGELGLGGGRCRADGQVPVRKAGSSRSVRPSVGRSVGSSSREGDEERGGAPCGEGVSRDSGGGGRGEEDEADPPKTNPLNVRTRRNNPFRPRPPSDTAKRAI